MADLLGDFATPIVGFGAQLGGVALVVLFALIAFAIGGYWFFYIKPYFIRTFVWSHYNNAIVIDSITKAGKKNIDGKNYYILKNDKKALLPDSTFKDVHYGNTLSVWKSATGEYHPLKVRLNDLAGGAIEPEMSSTLNPNVINAYADALKYNQDRFAFLNKFAQYYPVISLVILGVMLLLIAWVVGGIAVEMSKNMVAASSNYVQASQEIHQLLQYCTNTTFTTPIKPPV